MNYQRNLIKIAPLWKNKANDGSEYFSGKYGNTRVIILSNKAKHSERAPDFNMYFEEIEQPQQRDNLKTRLVHLYKKIPLSLLVVNLLIAAIIFVIHHYVTTQ